MDGERMQGSGQLGRRVGHAGIATAQAMKGKGRRVNRLFRKKRSRGEEERRAASPVEACERLESCSGRRTNVVSARSSCSILILINAREAWYRRACCTSASNMYE